MIDEKFCKSQLDRIAHLQGFPKLAAGVRDMICGLQAAETESIARGVVDYWISNITADHPTCPLAADLRRLAYEANEREAIKHAESAPRAGRSWHCAKCHDFGITESTFAADNDSIATWCDCEAGTRRKRYEPSFVDLVMSARAKLKAKFGKQNAFAALAKS